MPAKVGMTQKVFTLNCEIIFFLPAFALAYSSRYKIRKDKIKAEAESKATCQLMYFGCQHRADGRLIAFMGINANCYAETLISLFSAIFNAS